MLATLLDKYKDQGLQIVSISVDDDDERLAAWLAKQPLTFPVARDPKRALMDTFTQRAVPTTLWIKRDGTIRLRTTGVPSGGEKRLEELVKELVGG